MTVQFSVHGPTKGLGSAKRLAAASATALLLSSAPLAAHAEDAIGNGLQDIIDTVLAESGGKVSGVLLHVSHPKKGEWTLSTGVSDRETEAPLSPYAHFRGGSLMKPLLASLTMQLIEDGRLSLDATMTELLPADIAGQFENASQITLRMLLNHTGGMPEWMTPDIRMAFAANPTRQRSNAEILASAASQEPVFEPGAGWSYSNTDYTLIAMIIEGVLGQPWREAVTERVLVPLGMSDTFLPEPGDTGMPENTFHGYLDLGSGPVDITAADPSMAGGGGGGALVTTTTDLVDFLDGLRSGSLFTDPATFGEMTTLVPASGPGGQDGYGLGLTHFTFDSGHELIGHTGGTAGYFSIVGYIPDLNLTIAVSQNDMSAYPDAVLAPVIALMERELAD